MKKEQSVFMLAARSSIYKILTVLVLMAALQMGFFYNRMADIRFLSDRQAADGTSMELGMVTSLERIVELSFTEQIFFVAFSLICVILAWAGSEKGQSKSEYTLQRLKISRERIFFLWAIYDICCIMVLFAVQLFVVLCMGRFYLEWTDEAYTSSQTIFLAFWRNDFLHSLLPLTEIGRWIRNGLMLIATGLETAFFGYVPWQGKRQLTLLLFIYYVILGFSDWAGHGEADLVKGGISLICIILTICAVLGYMGREKYEI